MFRTGGRGAPLGAGGGAPLGADLEFDVSLGGSGA